MGDSHSWKPGTRPGSSPSSAKPAADSSRVPAPGPHDNTAGRIVHDERGNAVWDWVKDTARIAIDSTSRLLRKLEVPELKMEDTQSQELRLESDRDQGGGYDPYGGGSGPTSGHTSGGASPASGSAAGRNAPNRAAGDGDANNSGGRYPNKGGGDPYGGASSSSGRTASKNPGGGYDPYGRSSGQSSGSNKSSGGGYDPYGKSVTQKPPRKP